jgi:hypothetical protein
MNAPIDFPAVKLVSDVKCYHCGHISGQIIRPRNVPLRVNHFVPRTGYTGPALAPGMKLRCERCGGPVFLEDTAQVSERPRVAKVAVRRKAA